MTARIIYIANWRRLHPAARIAFDPFWAARLWFARLWQTLRPACCGRPAVPPRIWST